MVYRYSGQSPALNGYGSEDSMSLSDEQPTQPTQRQLNDRRLAQAINYIAEEGGNDSPETFINRVDAIDEALVQRLSQQGRNYDPALYRRARALVREVQHDFEDAAQESSSPPLESLDSSILVSEDELPEYYTPSAIDALYREDEKIGDAHKDIRHSMPYNERKVELERIFKYGGPKNDPEQWARTIPAALHFPETFRMAHWESLKIDFDLKESNKKLKTEGKIVGTNVPYDHPHLERYKNLSRYDSGSRFKLPVSPRDIQLQISNSKLGTSTNLARAVKDFSNGTNRKEQIRKDYVPRIFLEEIVVGSQTPTEIRRAVNTTPTKPRTPVIGSSAPTGSIETTQSMTALIDHLNTPSKPTGAEPSKTPVSNITISRQKEITQVKEKARQAKERTEALLKKAQEAKEEARLAAEKAHLADEKSLEAAEKERKIQEAAALLGTSSVSRRIDRTRKEAIEASPRRQSGVSTAPATPKSPTKTLASVKITATSPQAIVSPKRPRGRPPKSPVTAPTTKPVVVTATTPGKTPVKIKRKLSVGAKPYTPEPKKPKITSTATSSVSVSGNRKVHFNSNESSSEEKDDDDDNEQVILPKPQPKPKVKKPSKPLTKTRSSILPEKKNTGRKRVTQVTKSTTKVSKAAAAGQAVRKAKTKRVVEEYVNEKEYQRLMEENRKRLHGDDVPLGSTRRGTKYLRP
ncbi:hypothetical protein P3342_011358 [Pyrenophora teres f. teres]|uniref:Uncharacterized protein n=1 Tax=Pyrenophora teres f. teres TaxID=97479 RepID=A0A6S6WDP7_9PLEO|nr:hypothetical protein HRS9122_07704 [Pyrenophora teres f. teres]KAE8858334.1 hypothetical protein PTNB29_07549 [Pyrenophora teres f. teres]KAK1909279.1 hypothetical protein P3342_011358 [Pyrenophora teres f. teres]CAE7206656.1 hypothetical protein PTTW11_09588 [Pyrenophora teres f. teres]